MAKLRINGQTADIDVEPDTPLLWAIRENIGLTGTKYGCGIALCGACTVHIDGVAVQSCGVQVSEAVGKQITTIEGLAVNGVLTRVQQAWVDNDVPQCGYCQSGMNHGGHGSAQGEAQADRRRHRRRHYQHLPLRHLPAGA
jgi:isoquinoline 1-oxidoreductase alpha subunit